jgi:hypothetical protein
MRSACIDAIEVSNQAIAETITGNNIFAILSMFIFLPLGFERLGFQRKLGGSEHKPIGMPQPKPKLYIS